MSVAVAINNYEMFRFYQGEKSNPFDKEKQSAQYMFWFYESVFEREFLKNDSSEWYSFFSMHDDMGKEFMRILSESDYERPTQDKKKPLFELWLTYLFKYKLYPEYGGENKDEKLYYSFKLN
jgi:hypothetical protein